MEEWKEYRLGELLTIKYGKDHKKLHDGSIPAYGSGGIMRYVNKSIYEHPSILIPRKGSLNNIIYIGTPFWTVDTMFWTIINTELVDPKYLYYAICKFDFAGLNVGSAVPSLTVPVIENIKITLPSLNKQKRIANILSSLDDKIELNRRINENLEQQAQALFKSWFVDFEPFKGGKFVDSELGMIPEELIISRIGDIPHTIESGRRPKGGAVLKGVPSIGAENIKGLGYYDYSKTKYIPEDFALTTNRGKVYGYELLIYKDGGKPGYFIPNYTIFGEGFPFDEMYINEHVFRLDFMSKEYNVFAYFYMQTPYIMNQLNSIGGKAAIPGINTKDVESLPIFNGDNKKIQEFGNLVLPMITTILRNCRENARLAQLRDTLLPRLMSGELAITDVDDRSIFQ